MFYITFGYFSFRWKIHLTVNAGKFNDQLLQIKKSMYIWL